MKDPDQLYIFKDINFTNIFVSNIKSTRIWLCSLMCTILTSAISYIAIPSSDPNKNTLLAIVSVVVWLFYIILLEKKYGHSEKKRILNKYLKKFWNKYVQELSVEEKEFLKKYTTLSTEYIGNPIKYYDEGRQIFISSSENRNITEQLYEKKILLKNVSHKEHSNYFISKWFLDYTTINPSLLK